jgi:hypothetical protein
MKNSVLSVQEKVMVACVSVFMSSVIAVSIFNACVYGFITLM